MKRMNYILGALLSVLVITACSKDEYLRYDTSKASLRFVYSSVGNDSLVYSFGLHPGDREGEVSVPLSLVGLASSTSRTVGVEVVEAETTAKENVDFSLLPSEFPADEVKGSLKVKLIRNSKLDNTDNEKDKASKRVLTIRLCGNEYFEPAPIDAAVFRIVITNELTKPTGWIFDEYSRVKHEFVIKHTGVATDYDTVWSTSEKIRWKGVLINALYEYNKAHPGQPLTDENGLPVTF